MSISAMSWAWEQPIDPTTKFVLLALADHANDVDFTCWPSLTHLENKTGYSRPTIWKAIDKLVEIGLMRRVGAHHSGATLYEVSVGKHLTYKVSTLPSLGNDVNGVGNHGNKLGNDVTPNHKNHQEPSGTINTSRTRRFLSPRFLIPTVEEVRTYCLERQNTVDPQRFIDYYTSNGWKVGRNSMKDWMAAVRTWEKPNRSNGNGKDQRSRAKRFSDKLDDIARRDIEQSGHTDKLG